MGALIVLGVAVWGWAHRAVSVDFALHYAVVEYIAEHWRWPSPDVLYLGAMNQYPPVSHTVAAVVGVLCGSPILGLHLVSTLSAFIAVAVMFILLRFRYPVATMIATTAAAVMLAALMHGQIFLGREIVGNFFFPQLFGEMCVIVLVWLRSGFAPTLLGEFAIAVGSTFALGWVYPIAAVHAGGIAVIWRALLTASKWRQTGKHDIRDLIAFVALAGAIVLAIVVHPRFAVTVSLAANNGYVHAMIPKWLVVPATALLILLSMTLGFAAVRGTLALRAPLAFVSLCGGVAAASLAQAGAFHVLGLGSAYATHKHLFPVTTLLVCAAVVLVVNMMPFAPASTSAARSRRAARLAFVPATLIVLVANIKPWTGEPMAPLMREEAFLRKVVAERPDVEGHALVLPNDEAATREFAFSMGALHLPLDQAVMLVWPWSSSPKQRADAIAQTPIGYAFVRSAEVKDPTCVVTTDAASGLVLVRYRCQVPDAGTSPR